MKTLVAYFSPSGVTKKASVDPSNEVVEGKILNYYSTAELESL